MGVIMQGVSMADTLQVCVRGRSILECFFRGSSRLAFTAFLLATGMQEARALELMQDVDAAIVLAADMSASMDGANAQRQKIGHIRALQSGEVLDAILTGPKGCIAVTYVEWASVGSLRTVLPWTLVCNREQATRAALIIEKSAFAGFSRRIGGRGTSISFAIDVGRKLLDDFPAAATRKVIDISSNGTNNHGLPVARSRERALDNGYIINAIVLAKTERGITEDLPGYFSEYVIGGAGSFVIVPDKASDYSKAILRKLALEIAGGPESRPQSSINLEPYELVRFSVGPKRRPL
jgi:hypothetical protein